MTIETQIIAGLDEVGRGCLAGPVFAAAVVLPEHFAIPDLRDSKKLSAKRRVQVDREVKAQALAWSIGKADPGEIDEINILQATFLAMRRALSGLGMAVDICRVDGNQDPGLSMPTQLIIGGDNLEPSIMAASVIAKVARDQEMERLDVQHPGYAFAKNKGYGTPAHLAGLKQLGPSSIHRMSFSPCLAAREQWHASEVR